MPKKDPKGTKKKIVPINFNLNDPHEQEIYNWYAERTENVSGFMKDVLFLYKEMRENQPQINIHIGDLTIPVPQDGSISTTAQEQQTANDTHQTEQKSILPKRRKGNIPGI